MTEEPAREPVNGRFVESDRRGRISIGRADRSYLLHEEADGTVVLVPAVVVSELEHRFLHNLALQAQLVEARSHPEQQVPHRRRRPPIKS